MGAVMLENTGMDEDVTAAGETQAIVEDAEEDDSELAWSAEEFAVDLGREGRHWPVWAALVIVLCAVTGVAVWLGTVFYQQQWGTPHSAAVQTPQAPTPVPAPTETVAAPLPAPGPPVQHENPPPPVAQPDPDQRFLALVAAIPGVTVTDPQLEINETKNVCAELRNGVAPGDIIEATLREAPGLTRGQAEQVFDAGTTVYCPKFARR